MKLNGHKIEGPNRDIVVIPRGNGNDIVFNVQAVLNMEPFEQTCPAPRPPLRKIQGVDVPQFGDPAFKKALEKYGEQRMAWISLKSLEATPELEWDTVDIDDPSTWENIRTELHDSGFSDFEINRIFGGTYAVNSLNEAKVQAARERFLLQREAQQNELASLLEEPSITLSGELASVSE